MTTPCQRAALAAGLVVSLWCATSMANGSKTTTADTIAKVAVDSSNSALIFWTSTATHSCGKAKSTRFVVPIDDRPAVEQLTRLIHTAFLAQTRVAATYTCNGPVAIVTYVETA